MEKIDPKSIQEDIGFILLEILIGLFIVGLGFTALLGATQAVTLSNIQAHQLLQAANLAASAMEEVICDLEKHHENRYLYLQADRVEQVGIFQKSIRMIWDSSDLIRITIEIEWTQQGRTKHYVVERLFYMHE